MVAKQLITKSEFARRAGVSAAAVSKACGPGCSLASAVEGRRIDAAHPAAVEYLKAKTAPKPESPAPGVDPLYEQAVSHCHKSGRYSANSIKKGLGIGATRAAKIFRMMESAGLVPKKGKAPPQLDDDPSVADPDLDDDSRDGESSPTVVVDPAPRGQAAANEKKKNQPPIEPGEIPENIQSFADLTLRELIQRFGTDTRFLDWLRSMKSIEDIREKRIKNAEREGELIPRDLVEKHIIGQFEQAHIGLLTDGAKTIASRLHSMYNAGADTIEGQEFVNKAISKNIRSAKATIARVLKNA